MEQVANEPKKCPSTNFTQAEMLESMEAFESDADVVSLQDLVRFNKTLVTLIHFGVDVGQKLEEQLRFLALVLKLQEEFLLPSLGFDKQCQVNAFIKVLSQELEKTLMVSVGTTGESVNRVLR